MINTMTCVEIYIYVHNSLLSVYREKIVCTYKNNTAILLF